MDEAKTIKCPVDKVGQITYYKYYSLRTNKLVAYGVEHEDCEGTSIISKQQFESQLEYAKSFGI